MHLVGEHRQGAAAERHAEPGGGAGDAEGERLVAWRTGCGLVDDVELVVDECRTRDRLGEGVLSAGDGATALHAVDAPPEPPAGPVDGAGGGRHAAHQHVGVTSRVGDAHRPSDRVLLLEHEHVARAAGDTVQLAAHRVQHAGRALELVERRLERRDHVVAASGDRPVQHVAIAQPAASILQVRFEQRAHLAGARPALLALGEQQAQPVQRTLAPLHARVDADGVHDGAVAGERAHAEDGRRRDEVAAGELQQRLGGVGGRAELEPGVPERVPHVLGDALDLTSAGAGRVQQHDVEITAGTQRTPGVAADRHQRPPAWEHLAERGEPAVGLMGERARQRLAGERRVADQGESGGADRAGVRWPLAGASGHRSERVAQGVDELGAAEAGVELQGTDEPGAALDGVELEGPELPVSQPEPAVERLGGWSTPSIT